LVVVVVDVKAGLSICDVTVDDSNGILAKVLVLFVDLIPHNAV